MSGSSPRASASGAGAGAAAGGDGREAAIDAAANASVGVSGSRPRYATKIVAIELATLVGELCVRSEHFDLRAARKACEGGGAGAACRNIASRECKYLCFEIALLVSTASIATGANFEGAELMALKEAGLTLMNAVLAWFGPMDDPELDSVEDIAPQSVLELFEAQIVTALRAAFVDQNAAQSDAGVVEIAGVVEHASAAVASLIANGVTRDPVAAQRLIGLLLPDDLHLEVDAVLEDSAPTNQGVSAHHPAMSSVYGEEEAVSLVLARCEAAAALHLLANGALRVTSSGSPPPAWAQSAAMKNAIREALAPHLASLTTFWFAVARDHSVLSRFHAVAPTTTAAAGGSASDMPRTLVDIDVSQLAIAKVRFIIMFIHYSMTEYFTNLIPLFIGRYDHVDRKFRKTLLDDRNRRCTRACTFLTANLE